MATLIAGLKRRWRCDLGAEFVEFALAFPLLMLVLMGIFDFGLMFQQYEVLTNAAREGARIAVLPGYSEADVDARVQAYINASFLSMGGSVTVDSPLVTSNVSIGGGKCISEVNVTVRYFHNYLFVSGIMGYFGGSWGGSKQLTASSTMRSEITASSC
jgi:Flp pilus assembly protein TadG